MRRKETSQLVGGECGTDHTTVQVFNMSLYFSRNRRICKARFVLTWWKGSEGLAGSPLGGVALILAWQKDVSASYVPARGGFIREQC